MTNDTPDWSPGQPSDTPYADAAWVYRRAGWDGVLPLPTRKKAPVPVGWTGHDADYPSGADIQAWTEEKPGGNIALRMPADVIGLDVDHYDGKMGGATLATLEAEFGALPPTWVSTSRRDGVSGIRLYRVRPGVNWPGQAGPHIEIIQKGHRYLVAAPSIHDGPDGRLYRWITPEGTDAERLPTPSELPELPEAWITGLARTYERTQPADMATGEVQTWLKQLRPGDACRPVTNALHTTLDALGGRGGGRHDIARDALRNLLGYGGEGHAGVVDAVRTLMAAFLNSTTNPATAGKTRDSGEARAEWTRLLLGGVRIAAAGHPVPAAGCDCVTDDELYNLAGDGVDDPPQPPADPSEAVPPPDTDSPPAEPSRIDITFEPAAIRRIGAALRAGHIPHLYVRDGHLVQVGDYGGGSDEHLGPILGVDQVTADGLRRLLAAYTFTYREKTTKQENTIEVPAVPAVATCKAVLTETAWPGVRPLRAVVASPVLRPDGTLLQSAGYDAATALYYSPDLDLPPVPDHPDANAVTAARDFVVDHVLVDFPWATPADLANYMALLVTPILRPYIRSLVPLGAISATERGSGKTLLTTIPGRLYGSVSRPWTSDDEELRKAITSTLDGHAPVIVFDNVGERDEVASPVLAKLLTSKAWNDRLLGSNTQANQTNDRMWLVTGNNIAFGGDIAQRTVLVRLDPKMPRPDLRTGFRIADLEEWLDDDSNRAQLLHALLVLVRAWIASGARTEEFAMRGFRRWACALGGFLAHHHTTGFLANADQLEQHDEEEQRWSGFLKGWYEKFGSTRKTAQDLLNSVETVPAFGFADPWSGLFITRSDGRLPSVVGLGKMLGRRRGRIIGGLTLCGEHDKDAGSWKWWVQPYVQPSAGASDEGAKAA